MAREAFGVRKRKLRIPDQRFGFGEISRSSSRRNSGRRGSPLRLRPGRGGTDLQDLEGVRIVEGLEAERLGRRPRLKEGRRKEIGGEVRILRLVLGVRAGLGRSVDLTGVVRAGGHRGLVVLGRRADFLAEKNVGTGPSVDFQGSVVWGEVGMVDRKRCVRRCVAALGRVTTLLERIRVEKD